MPNTTTINSIITKLTSQVSTNKPLIFNSLAAIKKREQIKNRLSFITIEQTSLVVLGSFLQDINLDLFTDEELEVLVKFNYSFIENKVATTKSQVRQNLNKPYYDLGGNIVNIEQGREALIKEDFSNRHNLNKSLDLEFLAQFIMNQL